MIRRPETNPAAHAAAAVRRWFGAGTSRTRLRRKLFAFSVPMAAVVLLAAAKVIAVVATGDSAVAAFARHDITELHGDVESLSGFNVVEPRRLPFAVGGLRVLEGRLAEADDVYARALANTGAAHSCPVRVNLELVRETRGDLAARDGEIDAAEQQYRSALQIVEEAPADCFAGNDDPDAERRTIREEAKPRLLAKLERLHPESGSGAGSGGGSEGGAADSAPQQEQDAPPPEGQDAPPPEGQDAPPQQEQHAPTPPAPSNPPSPKPQRPNADAAPIPGGDAAPGSGAGAENGTTAFNDVDPDRLPVSQDQSSGRPAHRLDPERGKPLERLRDVLSDADSSGSSSE